MKRYLLALFAPVLIVLFSSSVALLAPQPVSAADPYGLEATRSKTPFKESSNSLPETVGSIISVVLSMIGLVFLVLALYAGFKWMTAQGNTKQVTEAKDTMVNATIGIILIAAAYTITNFVFTDVVSQI